MIQRGSDGVPWLAFCDDGKFLGFDACPCIIYENDERYQLDATIYLLL